jgi:hypothetical protein
VDFKYVMGQLVDSFGKQGIDYALMGGFALGVWGAPRATVDMDFLILLQHMDSAHAILTGLGYELRYKSDNVSQYISPLRIFGEIDFLHAFRDVTKSMLERAQGKAAFGGEFSVKVLVPEDIIGLKVQAVANDPSRRERDIADIQALLQLHSPMLDWELMQSYFELFEFEDLYGSLKEQYGKTE